MRKIARDPGHIRKINVNLDSKFLEEAIDLNYQTIWYLENPSQDLILRAINNNVLALRNLKPQPTVINLFAVELDPKSIKYIANPELEVQLAAVSRNGLMIREINNPTLEVQMAAVKNIPEAIHYIQNPLPECELFAIEKNAWIIGKMQTAHINTVIRALEIFEFKNYSRTKDWQISHLNLSEEDWWTLVERFPRFYEQMNLTEEQIGYAILCS